MPKFSPCFNLANFHGVAELVMNQEMAASLLDYIDPQADTSGAVMQFCTALKGKGIEHGDEGKKSPYLLSESILGNIVTIFNQSFAGTVLECFVDGVLPSHVYRIKNSFFDFERWRHTSMRGRFSDKYPPCYNIAIFHGNGHAIWNSEFNALLVEQLKASKFTDPVFDQFVEALQTEERTEADDGVEGYYYYDMILGQHIISIDQPMGNMLSQAISEGPKDCKECLTKLQFRLEQFTKPRAAAA